MTIEFLAPNVPENARNFFLYTLKNYPIKTDLMYFDWGTYRRELVNACIHRSGADVAEVGSTWLGSMVSMDCLRPFSNQELQGFGGRENFFEPLWHDITIGDDQKTWGVPFRADTRVIFYWEDILEAAGVDATTAFTSFDSMSLAFTKLQQFYPAPWVVPTQMDCRDSLYNLSSWLHKVGGSFLSDSGRETAFALPAALDGIQAYFDLYRFLPKTGHPFSNKDARSRFICRESPVTMDGSWLFNDLLEKDNIPENLLQRVKVALPPGPSFVGGTLLVVFRHAKELTSIINLLKHLYESDFLSHYCSLSGLLPVQKSMWTDEYLRSDPSIAVYYQAILGGRNLPNTARWGLVEDRLSVAVGSIWKEIYDADFSLTDEKLRAVVAGYLESAAHRLDVTLST